MDGIQNIADYLIEYKQIAYKCDIEKDNDNDIG